MTSGNGLAEPDYRCRLCGTLSTLALSPVQAFCTGGDACPVLMFNPSLPDGGISQAATVDLSFLDPQGPGGVTAEGSRREHEIHCWWGECWCNPYDPRLPESAWPSEGRPR